MTGRAYIHGRIADTSLGEIHKEMSELLDKQVNAQKESLKKYLRDSHKLPHAHEKLCDENESRNMTGAYNVFLGVSL